MTEKKLSKSERYLRILGIVYLVFGFLILLAAIVFLCLDKDLASFNIPEINDLITKSEGHAGLIKIILGGIILFAGAFNILKGWLLRRGANNHEKATPALVVMIISTAISVYALFTSGFASFDSVILSVLGIALDVLAIVALITIRKAPAHKK